MHLNREQAKLILSCHTWEEDSQGEDLEAALALLETDPELAEWFEAEKKWDQTISKELANSPIPNGLLGDVTRAYERGLEDRQARSTKQRMLSGLLIAGTFGLLVVGVVGFFLKPYFIDGNGHHTVVVEAAMEQDAFRATPQTFASFRQEITDFVADRFALSNYESDYPAMESWVTAHGGASLGALPAAILRSRGIGCNVVTWSGGTCSLICFRNEDGAPIHLFVTPLDTVTALPSTGDLATQVASRELNTAAWIDGGHVYFLCASQPGMSVNDFLLDSEVAAHPLRLHSLASL